eukprot:scaffold24473_cov126-Isochrysis_galbana.AAC.2
MRPPSHLRYAPALRTSVPHSFALCANLSHATTTTPSLPPPTQTAPFPVPHGVSYLTSHHLKVVKLPGRRPCHDPRPVDRHTEHITRRVERATALCHAHRRIDALHPLTIASEDHAVAATRFDHVERIRVPDFDRLVPRSGHDLGPVRGKRHRGDNFAVGVDLLALELECACVRRQEGSDSAEEG